MDLALQDLTPVSLFGGGRALEFKATPQGNLWAAKLNAGTTVNVRDFSSSGVGRWTVDIQQNPTLIGLSKRNSYEVKFK